MIKPSGEIVSLLPDYPDDRLLEKGDAASFDGVLVSEPRYRDYTTCMDSVDIQRQALNNCESALEDKGTTSFKEAISYVVVGAAAGFLASEMLRIKR